MSTALERRHKNFPKRQSEVGQPQQLPEVTDVGWVPEDGSWEPIPILPHLSDEMKEIYEEWNERGRYPSWYDPEPAVENRRKSAEIDETVLLIMKRAYPRILNPNRVSKMCNLPTARESAKRSLHRLWYAGKVKLVSSRPIYRYQYIPPAERKPTPEASSVNS